MKNRKILYGYVVENGELHIHPEEATVVQRVMALYTEELSYQKISDILNGEDIPFSPEAPSWNKHKVKRLLENPRYTGANGYPPIIELAVFQEVQLRIRDKTANYSKRGRPVPKAVAREEAIVSYTPSDEVIRLTNAINRGLEHLDTPEDVVALILQGISARYDCLK